MNSFELKTVRTAYGMTQASVARAIGVNAVYISQIENKRPVPDKAKRAVDGWLTRNTALQAMEYKEVE